MPDIETRVSHEDQLIYQLSAVKTEPVLTADWIGSSILHCDEVSATFPDSDARVKAVRELGEINREFPRYNGLVAALKQTYHHNDSYSVRVAAGRELGYDKLWILGHEIFARPIKRLLFSLARSESQRALRKIIKKIKKGNPKQRLGKGRNADLMMQYFEAKYDYNHLQAINGFDYRDILRLGRKATHSAATAQNLRWAKTMGLTED